MLNHTYEGPPYIEQVIEARHAGGYRIWLRFDDGLEGQVDFDGELWGAVFEPLKEVEYFKRFRVEHGTLIWPNGADVCHSVLYRTVLESTASTRPV